MFRPEVGGWYVNGQTTEFLGLASDVAVPGDYDGDGTTERAVFRNGAWFIDRQTTRFLGATGDVPVPADYNGDGATDRALFPPEYGGWDIDGMTTEFIGLSTDVPGPANYNGDGTAERAVYRPQVGGWYVQGETTVFYGLPTDVPLPLPAAVYNTIAMPEADGLRVTACDGSGDVIDTIGYNMYGVGLSTGSLSIVAGGSAPYGFEALGLDSGFSMDVSGTVTHIDAIDGLYEFSVVISDATDDFITVPAVIVYANGGLPATC